MADSEQRPERRSMSKYEARHRRMDERRAQAEVAANGTIARLITQHKGPRVDPTPGADYGKHDPKELEAALKETHAHAIEQWQARKGVVGPTGSEDNPFFSWFNRPTSSSYEANQLFAYHHDMQATDAELQANAMWQKRRYAEANSDSAMAGMLVLKATGDVDAALRTTRNMFKVQGFSVRTKY